MELVGSGIGGRLPPSGSRPGLVRGKVEVHRGGTTFEEERWLRPEDMAKRGAKTGGGIPGQQPFGEIPETKTTFDDKTKSRLNAIVNKIRGMKPGEIRNVNNVNVKSLPHGFYGTRIGRNNIIVYGLRGLSLIVDKIGAASSTAAALTVGDIQGKTVKQGVGAQQLERKGEQIGFDVQRAQRRSEYDEETMKRLREHLEKRKAWEAKMGLKEKYMKQKRDVMARITADKVNLSKVDSMNDLQVINLSQRLGIQVHDDEGNMYDPKELKSRIVERVLELSPDKFDEYTRPKEKESTESASGKTAADETDKPSKEGTQPGYPVREPKTVEEQYGPQEQPKSGQKKKPLVDLDEGNLPNADLVHKIMDIYASGSEEVRDLIHVYLSELGVVKMVDMLNLDRDTFQSIVDSAERAQRKTSGEKKWGSEFERRIDEAYNQSKRAELARRKTERARSKFVKKAIIDSLRKAIGVIFRIEKA